MRTAQLKEGSPVCELVSLLDSTEQCKRELDEVWTCDNVSRWYWVRTVKYCFSDERISIKVDFAFECADQDLAHGRQHMRGKLFPSELTTAFEFLAPTLQAGDGESAHPSWERSITRSSPRD